MIPRLLLIVAGLITFHAAYSTYEYVSHLKALGKTDSALPTDIIVETIVGMLLGIVAASLNAPPLKEITWASEMRKRTIDEMDSRMSLGNFVPRGRNFLPQPKDVSGQVSR
ncbi:magnesium transporter [Pterulicium gracile]|uniref:Magnesium transporter n=1 Tax=Pterulicium gracile TaxID=1884261 RepID=A0A5C3QX49_9AGAR|nr:magnesium transporter [Pterula gracilis]